MNIENNMNKEGNEKWAESLRDKMEGYTEPLPEGLWEELEGELSAPVPKIVPFWMRWPAKAAAVALVLVLSSLALTKWWIPALDNSTMQQANRLAEQLVDETRTDGSALASEKSNIPVKEDVLETAHVLTKERIMSSVADEKASQSIASSDKRRGQSSHILAEAGKSAVASTNRTTVTTSTTTATTTTTATMVCEEEAQVEEEKNDEATAGQASEVLVPSCSYNRPRLSYDYAEANRNYSDDTFQNRRKHNSGTRFEVGVHTGSMPYGSSKQYQGMGRLASLSSALMKKNVVMTNLSPQMTAYNQVLFKNSNKDSHTDIKHHMPINVVASFKWYFTPDWALETGLSYTYLQSDLHSGSNLYLEDKQKLHYIGIPLKVHRNIWGNDRFNFYASAGGMIEKCVSGELQSVYVGAENEREEESISLDVDKLQFSLSASLGAQVNMIESLSLFVEPGMAYFFDDGSRIETIRKEHPFNFNLQFGLRYSLSR